MNKTLNIAIKRVYKPESFNDGLRILVDRIWPRGVSKEKANLYGWYKQIAPSTELRKWYQHDPAKYKEFARRYKKELESDESQKYVKKIKKLSKTQRVTLVFASKDIKISNAYVLKKYLLK